MCGRIYRDLETKADSKPALPVMRCEAARFECRQEFRRPDGPPSVSDDAIAEIKSECETAGRVVLNDTANIHVRFGTACSFVREDAAARLSYAEWIATEMNEA